MYIIRKYNFINTEWVYMNSYSTYAEAREAREWMEKRYGGRYEIFEG